MNETIKHNPEQPIGNLELPIWQVMPEIVQTMRSGNRLALVSETGSGKSTQVPQALWQAGFADTGTIYVVENRVAVAAEVARRVASEMHVPLGETVGYVTGNEQKRSKDSKIIFVTNGVFKNIIRNDPGLTKSSVVIFDEFDERYLLSDIGLALTEKAQDRGSQAKFILMSATLNANKIVDHFPTIPVIEAKGRPFPVEPHYGERNYAPFEMPREAAKLASLLHTTKDAGDILIFMPGKGEIEATMRAIDEQKLVGITTLSLHAELSQEDRNRVFEKTNGRKIIVSTNVAERGLTIDGVKYVIDSGLAKMQEYDPLSDSTKLGVMKCAQDSIRQRQGRAGRTQPGECYFLFTQDEFLNRPVSTKPEIQRSALRSVVLQIKAMGYSREGDSIRLMDAPEKQHWTAAKQQLRMLDLLNYEDETKLSILGEAVAELGCDPRDGVMILRGCEMGCGEEMAIIAAIRSCSKRLLYRPVEKAAEADIQHQAFRISVKSDLLNLLLLYRQAEASDFSGSWCREKYVSWQALREIRQNVTRLLQQAQKQGFETKTNKLDEQLYCKAIATGFVDKTYQAVGGGWYEHIDTKERVMLGRDSMVRGAECIVVHELIQVPTKRGGVLPLITSATVIEK